MSFSCSLTHLVTPIEISKQGKERLTDTVMSSLCRGLQTTGHLLVRGSVSDSVLPCTESATEHTQQFRTKLWSIYREFKHQIQTILQDTHFLKDKFFCFQFVTKQNIKALASRRSFCHFKKIITDIFCVMLLLLCQLGSNKIVFWVVLPARLMSISMFNHFDLSQSKYFILFDIFYLKHMVRPEKNTKTSLTQ